MTLTHRNATLDDVEDIVAIYNQTISSRMVTADLEPVTVKQKMGWFLDHSPSYRPIWVFFVFLKICAWVSFQAFHERAAYDKTAELSIYIHEDYRGKKMGTQIMETVLAACDELDITNLVCLIFGHNAPSIGLMKKFGFEQWGYLPRVAELDGIERDLVYLGKRVRV